MEGPPGPWPPTPDPEDAMRRMWKGSAKTVVGADLCAACKLYVS